MAASRSNSGASRRTQESLPVFSLYPSTITKDSKAQNILGLSRTELHSARTQSLKPRPFSSNNENSLIDRSTIRTPLPPTRKLSVDVSIDETDVQPSPGAQHEDSRSSDVASWSRTTSLKKHSSTSTLRSFYEAATSSTRDLVSVKGSSNMSPARNLDTEPSKQFRFFKSPKLRSIKETKPTNKDGSHLEDQTNLVIPSRKSSYNASMIKSPLVTDVSVGRRPSAPNDLHPTASPRKSANDKYQGAEHLLHENRSSSGVATPTVNTPYAKINVRRPKAGTQNWFDDLEGITSDEDDSIEPEFTRRFVVNDHGSFQSVRNSAQTPVELDHGQPQDLKSMQTQITNISELPTKVIEPISSPGRNSMVTRQDSKRSISSGPKPNPFVEADLQQESVLHLSDGEDGDNDDNDDNDDDEIKDETKDILLPLQPVQSSEFRPVIRNSLTLEACEESDVEIGLAHTVKPPARLAGNRPLSIKLVDAKGQNSASSTPSTRSLHVTPEPRCYSSGSGLNENLDTKDMDEDALLSSFPATPTSVHMPRRTSARSSASFSDDRSMVSMKMMPVTRQEENLISAMRMKRAAMKRAEKAAANGHGTKSPDHADKVVVSAPRMKLSGRTARLSEFAMLQYGPPLKDISQDVNRPLRSVLTDSYGSRTSTAPLLSRYLAETQMYELPVSPSGQEMSRLSRTPSTRQSFEPLSRPQSYQSTTSGESQQCNNNLIVLDNLNSGLTAQAFPSQLCMESPFVSWKRTDSATVH